MEYYTYAYLREDGTPYYIGKGKGDRVNHNHHRRVHPPKDKSRIIFLKKNISEDDAFRHEIYMIHVLGRKDLGTGILHNMTNGGEGPSGCVRSEKFKKNAQMMMKKRKFICNILWTLKNVNTGETLHVVNLSQWCRENNMSSGTLNRTQEGSPRKLSHHKHFRIVSKTYLRQSSGKKKRFYQQV